MSSHKRTFNQHFLYGATSALYGKSAMSPKIQTPLINQKKIGFVQEHVKRKSTCPSYDRNI